MNNFYDNLIGHTETLQNFIQIEKSGRIPHAFLFTGKSGIGKHNFAINFAKSIVSNSVEKSITNQIKKIDNLEAPAVKYVIPLPRGKGEGSDDTDTSKLSENQMQEIREEIQKKVKNPYYPIKIEKANNIKISSIRELKKFISINYDDYHYRFIIISEAHLMNDEAQNALLKSLEEPAKGIIFILITPHKEKLLKTIYSRCWQINFNPLKPNEVKEILQKHFPIEKKIASKLSNFSEGSVTTAFNLIENDFEILIEKSISIVRYSLAKYYGTAFQIFNEVAAINSRNSVNIAIELIQKWLIDVIRFRDLPNPVYHFNQYEDTFKKFNQKFINVDVEKIYSATEKVRQNLDTNINLNIIMLSIIFELASLQI